MTQLAASVNSTEELWTVDTLPTAPYATVGSETVAIRAKFPSQTFSLTGQATLTQIRVDRGVGGTTAASHTNGSALTPVYGLGGGGGEPFNGGTVTGAIILNPADPDAIPLEVDGHADQDADLLSLNSSTEGSVTVSRKGSVSLTSVLTADMLSIAFAAALNSNVINVSQNFGSFLTVWRLSDDGFMILRQNAAPADAALAANEMAIWFDSTNGAAKLMVKAKQADGTVRTGELALT